MNNIANIKLDLIDIGNRIRLSIIEIHDIARQLELPSSEYYLVSQELRALADALAEQGAKINRKKC